MSQTIQQGANTAVPTSKLTIQASHEGPDTDLSALLLTAGGKVRSDADFIFYGQPRSAEGSVAYVDKQHVGSTYKHQMTVSLGDVPADVERIAITLTIDPTTPATFASVKDLLITLSDEKSELVRMSPAGTTENAFIMAELYRRSGAWKVRHVAQGFNNGLAGIATAFGVSIEEPAQPTPPPASAPTPPPAPKLSLSKVEKVTADLEKKGSRLLSLQKSAALSLKKVKLDNIVARVMMVLDASGSTSRMWPDVMQAVLDRLATLALNMDDNGELEFWGYAGGFKKYETVKLSNLDGYIKRIMNEGRGGWLSSMSGILPSLGYDNNEPPVMADVLKAARETPNMPTLVLFVTDGGIDKDKAIEDVLRDASKYSVFWQFIGLGGSGYGILERFDSMTGRKVDNAGFFAIDDYRSVSDTELYDRILKEFPKWIEKARELGILPRA